MGCLEGIFALFFILGNVLLFFGELKNGNPFIVIMVFIAIIGDIAIIYWAIRSIAKYFGQAYRQKLHVKIGKIKVEINRIIKPKNPIVQGKIRLDSECIKKSTAFVDHQESQVKIEYIAQISELLSVLTAILSSKINEHEHTDNTFVTFNVAEDREEIVSEYSPQKIDYQSPIYEKQYIAQISELLSVLTAILSSKINKHEHTGSTFATFNVAEDREEIVSEYSPQKINYQSPTMKETVDKDPYSYFEKMRKIKAPQNSGFSINGIAIFVAEEGNASQFVAQAKYMETFEDNYRGDTNFQCYYPTYMNMNDEQLRTYFTWRTRVRRGQVEATSFSYACVYIYELLNLIGVDSAEEGMSQLLKFWSNYHILDDKIDCYIERWIKEFYVYYRLRCSYKSVLAKFPDGILKESFAQEEIYQHNYKNKDAYLNRLSSYKYLQSKFYNSKLGYTLIECIPLVLDRVDVYLSEQSISFPTLLLGNVITDDWWRPFCGAVVDVKAPSDSYSVKISSTEEYSFANGKWQSKKIQKRCHRNLLGYIIKTTEAELRELTGYKRKLKPNINSLTYDTIQDENLLMVINNPEFTDIIRSVVMTYFANSGIRPQAFKIAAQEAKIPIKPVEVKIDLSKLESIRSAATEIQNRLLIDVSEEDQIGDKTDVLIKETNVTVTSTKAQQSENVSDEMQKATLSEPQRICISIITSGQNVNPRIAELSIKNGTLPEVMIESINDLLFESFGDNVIDSTTDIPYIYNDYLDDVKKLIKGD